MRTALWLSIFLAGCTLFSGCVAFTGAPVEPGLPPGGSHPSQAGRGQPMDKATAERLQRLILPLLRVMERPPQTGQARVSVLDDPQINAGSAGNGDFVVTSGLLRRATDDQLQSVMAHEIAHDELGHAAKAQGMGAGVTVATILLDQIFPGSGQITPVAGDLLIRAYGRNEEYSADKRGVELLDRLHPGKAREMMIGTLTWLKETAGGGGGGFFATHPDTGDRIERLRALP